MPLLAGSVTFMAAATATAASYLAISKWKGREGRGREGREGKGGEGVQPHSPHLEES